MNIRLYKVIDKKPVTDNVSKVHTLIENLRNQIFSKSRTQWIFNLKCNLTNTDAITNL